MSIDIDKGFNKISDRKKMAKECWRLWGAQIKKHEQAEKRVEQMKLELVQTDLSCKVISLNAGIRIDSGARLFKGKTGKTMKQFRDENRSKPQ